MNVYVVIAIVAIVVVIGINEFFARYDITESLKKHHEDSFNTFSKYVLTMVICVIVFLIMTVIFDYSLGVAVDKGSFESGKNVYDIERLAEKDGTFTYVIEVGETPKEYVTTYCVGEDIDTPYVTAYDIQLGIFKINNFNRKLHLPYDIYNEVKNIHEYINRTEETREKKEEK